MNQSRGIFSSRSLAVQLLGMVAFVAGIAMANPAPPPASESAVDRQAVESGREALQRYNQYPWYDADRDAVQRIDVQPPSDTTNRRSRWEAPTTTFSWPAWTFSLLEAAGWTLLAVAVLAVIYALFRALGSSDWLPTRGGGDDEDDLSLRGDVDRIESLPFQLKSPNADLLSEARRYFELGDYSQASIYLYSYELVLLDRHQLIRLAKGKTNRQYLRELRSRRDLADILRDSMVAFEEAFFGHHQLTRAEFEVCWNRLEAFQQLLEPVTV